ncbi:hypothetical protein ACFLT1_05720 [Bacteroidota bacterium]
MKKMYCFLLILLITTACKTTSGDPNNSKILHLNLERIDPQTWDIQKTEEEINPGKLGIVVVDMWDQHWCKSHSFRDEAMIPEMNRVLDKARSSSVQVIFSPADVLDFYSDFPQRKKLNEMQKVRIPEYPVLQELVAMDKAEREKLELKRYFEHTMYEARVHQDSVFKGYPTLSPFHQTGGCECGIGEECVNRKAWSRQHADLVMRENDLIIDGNSSEELYRVCKHLGITHLIFMGTAANMCVTWTRSSSLINMANRGIKCIVAEDLLNSITGNGFNPDTGMDDPGLTPEKGNRMVIDHIKTYMAPAVDCGELFKN